MHIIKPVHITSNQRKTIYNLSANLRKYFAVGLVESTFVIT
jgi:hypothetical protein